jgi:ergothioneine biosynthesis protein EgtB
MAPAELIERLRSVRATSELLASSLSAEDQTVQSMPDASPTKWHMAHTTWFFETFVLLPYAPAYEAFDQTYGFLFNSYYEGIGARHPRAERGLVSRPGVAEITDYRAHVDRWMIEFLECRVPEAIGSIVEVGLHHEQQHQELVLMDIHHVLGHPSVLAAYGRPPWEASGAGPRGWVGHDGGITEIGHGGASFAFDNEGPRHRVLLEPFEIARGLVTNEELAAFIDDGGYHEPRWWMAEGFDVARQGSWEAPMSWIAESSGWLEHTLEGVAPIDPAVPATNLSWFEADAYARWAGARLPSEAEWERAAPEPGGPDGAGWYGAAWQWTQSPYVAYPGYQVPAGAIGEYNGKFMVNQMVLRGSSRATPPGHARRSYRNFFPAASRWAFSGLRLARDA